MSRLQQLFAHKKERVLNIYCTAGYPHADSTVKVLEAVQDAGADIAELGMPYSDPLADGPVIQHSSTIALENGMTIERLFQQLRELRKTVQIPVVLMGYMNPVLQYGFERFCADAAAAGIDGLILPDLPEYEFETVYGPLIKKHGLDFIFLVTPETDPVRLRRLDSLSSGFLYAVSSSSTTGTDKDMHAVAAYLRRLQQMQLKNPVLVGFGIRDKASFDAACLHANGAIIGSAFVRALENSDNEVKDAQQFVRKVLA
ncbi:MAG: tryptophan synthase subunit alpha [Chitinophagaceae bacterium]|nr:tryptophan synthase subunit alpha [Chitinophagaceae bacterium]